MPVPLLKHHFLRRDGTGPKAHAHAAYLSGTKLDDGFGNTADFTPKGGILRAEVWVPVGAPTWAKDRGQLWKRLEAREDKTTRKAKAILAHKFIGALPHELSLEENIRYVKDYVREQFTRKGYAADWAIHAPDRDSDTRNYHVHIMVPLRKFENGDWAKTKDRFPKNSPALSEYIKEKQRAFFELQNRYLQKNAIDASIIRRNGKWVVTTEYSISSFSDKPNSTTSTAHAARTVPSARRGDEQASPPSQTKPASAPSGASLGLGGSGTNSSSPLKELLSHAARGTTSTSNSRTQHFKNPNTKSWPAAAITDWAAWGHRNPRKFFTLWPELGAGNPAPGGGAL